MGEDEADPSRGTVSYVSPLARAVLTCGRGDTVEIAGGKAVILDIRENSLVCKDVECRMCMWKRPKGRSEGSPHWRPCG